jgi:hypothetical protein
MDIPGMFESARPILIAFGLKVVGAIAAYIIGRMLIGFASKLVMKAMEQQKVEPTVIRYIGSIITVALNIVLVVAILGYFGVETTSFAALVAGHSASRSARPGAGCYPTLRRARSFSCCDRSRWATTWWLARLKGPCRCSVCSAPRLTRPTTYRRWLATRKS